LVETGIFGRTVLVFKNGGIYEPGFLGKNLFSVTKTGEVKEPGLLGRSVGAIPMQWVYGEEKIEVDNSHREYPTNTHTTSSSYGQDAETLKLEEELDLQSGYVADFSNVKEGAKTISVPQKYTKFTSIAPFIVRNGLETVKIHDKVKTILTHNIGCSKAFIVDENNPKFESENGVLYTKGKTEILRVPTDIDFSSFVIPTSVTKIGKNAFWGCNMESIEIPASVVEIGECAFGLCKKLKSVFISKEVKTIGVGAFQFDKKTSIKTDAEGKPSTWKCDFSENKEIIWSSSK